MKISNNVTFGAIVAKVQTNREKEVFDYLKEKHFDFKCYKINKIGEDTFKINNKFGSDIPQEKLEEDTFVEALLNMAGIKDTRNYDRNQTPIAQAKLALKLYNRNN